MMKKASIGKRGLAFAFDWYFGSVVSTIPVQYLWNTLTNETQINTDLTLFESPYGLAAGALGLLFGIFYFFIIPAFIWEGQTVGKKLLKLQIVSQDGSKLPVGRMALRQIVGIIFMEGAFMLTGNYFTQMISLVTVEQAGQYVGYVMAAVFVISVILSFKGKQSVHDMLARSIVIENE